MIPFDQIDARLELIDKDRKWLAEATGRSDDSIRAALAPNAKPKSRSSLLQKALSDAIEREEALRGPAMPSVSGIYEVRQTPEQADRTDRASRAVNAPSLAEFCLRAIMLRADEILDRNSDPCGDDVFSAIKANAAPENVVTFPEIPLIHAAAGSPITTDGDTYVPTRKLGPGRFAVRLHGDSMEPEFLDGSVVILRERESLRNPTLKRGEIYLFDIAGEKTLKAYESRIATEDEIDAGISYVSPRDGRTKVRVLRSINPDYPEIVLTGEVQWLGWLDKKDNA